MSGKPRHSPNFRQSSDRLSPLDALILTIMGTIAAVLILGMPALWLLEGTYKRVDRSNQEQIVWTCNGNGVASCSPYSKA